MCTHFGAPTVTDVVLRIHQCTLAESRLAELVPALFEADAQGDAIAGSIVDRLAQEITTMVRVVLDRAGLLDESVPVVLAGGVLGGGHRRLLEAVISDVASTYPRATVSQLSVRPVAGALVAALEAVPGAAHGAAARVLTSALIRSTDTERAIPADATLPMPTGGS